MAVAHVATTRENLATQVLTDIGNSGQMTLRTSGGTELATLTLPTTSGVVSGAVLDFGEFVDETNANAGVCDHLRIEDSGGSEVFRFNASGDGVTLSNTTIGSSDTVQCSDLTYTAPA